MSHMRATILGSGTSHGVPVIGCSCPVCRSTDPRNDRTRCSVLVEIDGLALVIDTSTDFRRQALREGITRIDGVLYTHPHADHLHGLDDTRSLTWEQTLPLYANRSTAEEIQKRFSYVFKTTQKGGGKPNVRMVEIDSQSFKITDTVIQPVPIKHGNLDILGFRIGSFAYLTDCSGIPEASFDLLRGLEVLVIGALRRRPHPTHFSVDQALATADRIGARRVLLTHICHDLDHASLARELPPSAEPAYDGQIIEI